MAIVSVVVGLIIFLPKIWAMIAPLTVSYTHLDVYKRQIL